MDANRRRHHREKISAQVFYKDEKDAVFGGCVAKNVSEKGVCIIIERFFPVGTILNLQFRLPLSITAFYANAKIVRIAKAPYGEQWEAGLEMLVEEKYAKLVREFIASQNQNKEQS